LTIDGTFFRCKNTQKQQKATKSKIIARFFPKKFAVKEKSLTFAPANENKAG
jgi:hypothetical protein